jgi:hypothetical protein
MESCSFLHHEVPDFAYEVDRTSGDDQSAGWGDGPSLSECGSEMRGCVRGNVESLGGGEQIFQSCSTGIVYRGKDDVVFASLGLSSTGVEEWEENLGHLFEVLVAKATEEKSTRTVLGKLGDRRTKSPGTGRIVGDVEKEIRAVWEG